MWRPWGSSFFIPLTWASYELLTTWWGGIPLTWGLHNYRADYISVTPHMALLLPLSTDPVDSQTCWQEGGRKEEGMATMMKIDRNDFEPRASAAAGFAVRGGGAPALKN